MSDIDYQRIANERAVSLAELKGEVDRLRALLAEVVRSGALAAFERLEDLESECCAALERKP